MENLIITEQTDDKRERRKQCITYLASLFNGCRKSLGNVTERHNLLRARKGREILEKHDRLDTEVTRHMKKKKDSVLDFFVLKILAIRKNIHHIVIF